MIYIVIFLGLMLMFFVPLQIYKDIFLGLLAIYVLGWLLAGCGIYVWIFIGQLYLSLLLAIIPCFVFIYLGVLEKSFFIVLLGLFVATCHFAYFLSLQ